MHETQGIRVLWKADVVGVGATAFFRLVVPCTVDHAFTTRRAHTLTTRSSCAFCTTGSPKRFATSHPKFRRLRNRTRHRLNQDHALPPLDSFSACLERDAAAEAPLRRSGPDSPARGDGVSRRTALPRTRRGKPARDSRASSAAPHKALPTSVSGGTRLVPSTVCSGAGR